MGSQDLGFDSFCAHREQEPLKDRRLRPFLLVVEGVMSASEGVVMTFFTTVDLFTSLGQT